MRYLSLVISFIVLSACESPIFNEKSVRHFETLGPSVERPFDQTEEDSEERTPESIFDRRGCALKFPDRDLCVHISWFDNEGLPVPRPIYYRDFFNQSMTAHLYFWTTNSINFVNPLELYKDFSSIGVKLWMPTMGHGSYVTETLWQPEHQRFLVTDLSFIMGASRAEPWDVKIQLKTADEDDDYLWVEDPHLVSEVILSFDEVDRR